MANHLPDHELTKAPQHLSLTYAANFISTPSRFHSEITGVITHEMVHAYQWDANGTCPGGLIEGIADYVRLKADLAPPHWKRDERMDKWDEGYQRTAYFLEWLEGEYGVGTVSRVNAGLREGEYEAKGFWTGIFGEGRDVEWLFKRFRESLKGEKGEGEEEEEAKDDIGGEEGGSGEDAVLVELEDAKMVVGAKFDRGEDGMALRW
jgi:hypothetical protein